MVNPEFKTQFLRRQAAGFRRLAKRNSGRRFSAAPSRSGCGLRCSSRHNYCDAPGCVSAPEVAEMPS